MAPSAGERFGLSAAQHGIWLGQQLDPESPAYWTAELVQLLGPLDEPAFERALRACVDATEALHMRYQHAEGAVWQTRTDASPWELRRVDVSGQRDPEHAARAWVSHDLLERPDLVCGPLFRTALLRLGPEQHLWYLRVHHIALDGYGYHLLIRRVGEAYTERHHAWPPAKGPAPSLREVVDEDEAYRRSPAFVRDRAFWCARLTDAPKPALLAKAKPAGVRVLRDRGLLPPHALASFQTAAAGVGVDWTSWLIAAIAAWLHRANRAPQQTLGLPVTARLGSCSLAVPCMAMNIVPLHVSVDPHAPFADLARRVAGELRALRPHQRYRYEDLRHDLGLVNATRRLFGPVVNIMPFEPPRAFGELSATVQPVSAGPVEDLVIALRVGSQGCQLDFEANADAYDLAQVAGYRESLLEVLETLSERSLMPVCELAAPRRHADAARAWVSGARPSEAPAPVLERIRAAAMIAPEQVAVEQEGCAALSYARLLACVQSLADRLAAVGVKPGDRVVVMLRRAPETIVAQLAVLWAGAAYVPLDPEGPVERIAMVLDDVAPTRVLTRREHAACVQGNWPVCYLDDDAASERRPALSGPVPVPAGSLAYVIYTSGSTGRPNGVMVSREALDHFVAAAGVRYEMRETDRVLQFAPLQFDASVEEIMLALVSGATLVLRTDEMLESLPRFVASCHRLAITVLDLPTAFWHELVYALGGNTRLPSCLRLTIIGGEEALEERVLRWQRAVAPEVVLLNTYGPTEATVVCCAADLAGPRAMPSASGRPAIGTPLSGIELAVVDSDLNVLNVGEAGELCILGPTLARGYLGRAELTDTRFVSLHALPQSPRGYLTGDRVCLGEDGQLRYLGRLDDELKVSGYRIAPAEVETALLSMPGIEAAAVVGSTSARGAKRLTAYLVASAQAPDRAAVRALLATRLPAPAVPSSFIRVACIPRDANGKLDRNALRAHELASELNDDVLTTPLEQIVMAVWSEVLGNTELAPDTDFFAAGGRSLQALQVASRLATALNRDVPLSALFRYPTVSALAQFCARGEQTGELAGQDPLAPLIVLQTGKGAPLFCIHPVDGLSWCYLGLTRHLPGVPVYGLQAFGLTGEAHGSFPAMVADYVEIVRSVQPSGPYRLLGWSAGGSIAHAVAQALRAAGDEVTLLAMLDSYPADYWHDKPEPTEQDALVSMSDDVGASRVGADGQPLSSEQLFARLTAPGSSLAAFEHDTLWRMCRSALAGMRVYRSAVHGSFEGDVLFFHAARRALDAPDWRRWQAYVGGRIERVDVDCVHLAMCQPAALAEIGRALAPRLVAPCTG